MNKKIIEVWELYDKDDYSFLCKQSYDFEFSKIIGENLKKITKKDTTGKEILTTIQIGSGEEMLIHSIHDLIPGNIKMVIVSKVKKEKK